MDGWLKRSYSSILQLDLGEDSCPPSWFGRRPVKVQILWSENSNKKKKTKKDGLKQPCFYFEFIVAGAQRGKRRPHGRKL